MNQHEEQPAGHQPSPHAAPAPEGGSGQAHQLVVRCAGDPTKLSHLLQTLSPALRSAVLAEAHRLYGNQFVQRAMQQEDRAETQAPASSGSDAAPHAASAGPESHSHVTPHAASAGPASQSHVSPHAGTGHAEPMAFAAMRPADGGGGPAVSFSTSQTVAFNEGDVHVSETVGASVSHGDGPVSFNLSKGGLSIGNEQMHVDLKSPDAVTGKGLKVSGAGVTVHKVFSTKSEAKVEDGYVGVDYETTWTVKGPGAHPWTTTFSISAFVGVKPPKPHHHWWQDIPVVSVVVGAAVAAVVAAGAAIVASAPEWGPVVVVALA